MMQMQTDSQLKIQKGTGLNFDKKEDKAEG